jgi:cell division protease FtsH
LQVALIYVVLIAVVLQRLPISFSQVLMHGLNQLANTYSLLSCIKSVCIYFLIQTQHSAGQLRNRKNSNSGRAKVSESTDIVTFADVAGVDEAKEELEEIVVWILQFDSNTCSNQIREISWSIYFFVQEFLRNPERYVRLGARPPRGVLLVGFANAISNGNYCLTIVFVTILLFFIYRWVFQGLERHFLQKP